MHEWSCLSTTKWLPVFGSSCFTYIKFPETKENKELQDWKQQKGDSQIVCGACYHLIPFLDMEMMFSVDGNIECQGVNYLFFFQRISHSRKTLNYGDFFPGNTIIVPAAEALPPNVISILAVKDCNDFTLKDWGTWGLQTKRKKKVWGGKKSPSSTQRPETISTKSTTHVEDQNQTSYISNWISFQKVM